MKRPFLLSVILILLFSIVGCSSYKIPIDSYNNPAATSKKNIEIELSPILNISQTNELEDRSID